MLTVACVYVRGPYPYTADYVVRLERMVRRYLKRRFWFVCLTDRPEELPTIDTIPIQSLAAVVPANGAGYWAKVRLFDPTVGLTHGRVLYLDLDTLVVSDLAPIVDFPAALALTSDAFVVERAHLNQDRYSRTLVRRFNSSVMVWDGGTQDLLFRDWTPAVAARLSTDQDWIAEHAPHAIGMPLAWFPRISQVQPPWPTEAKVVLVKKPKNHEAAEQWPWFEPLWGSA
jgi:hypothetical protein